MRFQDQVAVITAAGAGIGKATAEIMFQEGATVIAIDVDYVLLSSGWPDGLRTFAEEVMPAFHD